MILFAVTYILMLTFSKYRTLIALVSALAFIVSGMLPLNQILSSIDFNVLFMIAGTMGPLSNFLLTAKCRLYLPIWLCQRFPMCKWQR